MKIFSIFFITCIFHFIHVHTGSAQTNKPILQFGLITDIQYADCQPQINRYYKNSLKKLEESISDLNKLGVCFTINLGDLIDRDQNDLDTVLHCLKHLNTSVRNTTGNHDYKGLTHNEILYKKLGMPAEYYAFKKKNWVFVMLNTNEIASYANVEGTPKADELRKLKKQIKANGDIQGANYNGGISKQQLKWLKKLLQQNQKAGNNVLIFSHHPLYPQSEFTALNYKEILEVIGSYSCVKAIFCGHHHNGAFAYYNHVPVVTAEGMIETENQNAYGIIKIYHDKIVMEGKGRMTSYTLPYSQTKNKNRNR